MCVWGTDSDQIGDSCVRPHAAAQHNGTRPNQRKQRAPQTTKRRRRRLGQFPEAFMVFHVANAWEEGGGAADGGDNLSSGAVKLFVCAHESISLDLDTR